MPVPKSTPLPPPPRDLTEAVRDTVTLRTVSESPRNKVGRSHTAMYIHLSLLLVFNFNLSN